MAELFPRKRLCYCSPIWRKGTRKARNCPGMLGNPHLASTALNHLRTRKDWGILVDVWTVSIQDKKQHAEPKSFLCRGTAYLQLDDFDRGYMDLRNAWKLGQKESCAALAVLPKVKVTALPGSAKTSCCQCANL